MVDKQIKFDMQLMRALVVWVRKTALRETELLLAFSLTLWLLAQYLIEPIIRSLMELKVVEIFLTINVPAWTPIILPVILPAAIVIGFCAYYFYHLWITPWSEPAVAAADAKKEALDARADGFSYEEQKQRSADWAAARAERYKKEWAQPAQTNFTWSKEVAEERRRAAEERAKTKASEPAPKSTKKPRKAKTPKATPDAPAEAPKADPKPKAPQDAGKPKFCDDIKINFGSTKIDPTARTHLDQKKFKAAHKAALKAEKDRQAAWRAEARARANQSKNTSTPEPEATTKSHYKILGVHQEASVAEIKAAHRKLVAKCHPDRAEQGDEEDRQKREASTVEFNVARDKCLEDAAKRAQALKDAAELAERAKNGKQ